MFRRRTASWCWTNGRVNGFDTHENLLRTNPIYREIYEAQTQNGGDFDQPVPDGKEGDLA